jgi:hypothetical protein
LQEKRSTTVQYAACGSYFTPLPHPLRSSALCLTNPARLLPTLQQIATDLNHKSPNRLSSTVSPVQVNALLGALVLSASTAICWLCGKDPAGEAQAAHSSSIWQPSAAILKLNEASMDFGLWAAEFAGQSRRACTCDAHLISVFIMQLGRRQRLQFLGR